MFVSQGVHCQRACPPGKPQLTPHPHPTHTARHSSTSDSSSADGLQLELAVAFAEEQSLSPCELAGRLVGLRGAEGVSNRVSGGYCSTAGL